MDRLLIAIADETVNSLLRAMHRADSIAHTRALHYQGRAIDLQVGCPALLGSGESDQSGHFRFSASSRIYYNERDLAIAGEAGCSAVADVTIRVVVEEGRQSAVEGGTALLVDWRGTRREDITVYPLNETPSDVADVILALIRDFGGGKFTAPRNEVGRVESRLHELKPIAWGSLVVEPVGTNLIQKITSVASSPAEAPEWAPVLKDGWAVFIPQSMVLRELRRHVRRHFGGIGAPFSGDAVITLSHEILPLHEVPLVDDNKRRQTIIGRPRLDRGNVTIAFRVIDHTWRHGQYSFTESECTVRVVPDGNGGFTEMRPDNVDMQAVTTAYVDGREISVPALLAEALSDALTALVTRTERGKVFGSLSWQRLSDLIGIRGDQNGPFHSVAAIVEIEPDGILVHGRLIGPEEEEAPVASFISLPATGEGNQRIFNCRDSWVPGGTVARYEWNFGDGNSATFVGEGIRFVVSHVYSEPGLYSVSLIVADQSGRVASTAADVAVGAVTLLAMLKEGRALIARDGDTWRGLGADLNLLVLDGVTPISYARVTVSGPTGRLSSLTDGNGRVAFHLDLPSDVQAPLMIEVDGQGYQNLVARVNAER